MSQAKFLPTECSDDFTGPKDLRVPLRRLSCNENDTLRSRLTRSGWGCSSVGRASDRHATDARFDSPVRQRDFSPRVNFQCRLYYGVRTPPYAIACINICAHVKGPVVHVRSSVDYGNTKTPSMHLRLGDVTLPQLAFPEESYPNFPWEKTASSRRTAKRTDE